MVMLAAAKGSPSCFFIEMTHRFEIY